MHKQLVVFHNDLRKYLFSVLIASISSVFPIFADSIALLIGSLVTLFELSRDKVVQIFLVSSLSGAGIFNVLCLFSEQIAL